MAVFGPKVATFTSLMSPLFHLLVLFCRSFMKSSFVCQSPQLFPATNPSAKCCCAHEASFFICAFLDSCCSCLIWSATSRPAWALRLRQRAKEQSRLMAITILVVNVYVLHRAATI